MHQNLLAGETAISLGLMNLNKGETVNTCHKDSESAPLKNGNKELPHNVDNMHGGVCSRLIPLINTFQNTVFSGRIGKLKDYQVKLHVDKNIPPVAQKERRIPFALREKS